METADQGTVGGRLFWSNKHSSFFVASLPPPFFMPHSPVSHPQRHAPTPREQWRHLRSPMVILFHLLITRRLKILSVSLLRCPIAAVCCSLVVWKPSKSHQQKGKKKKNRRKFLKCVGVGRVPIFLCSSDVTIWLLPVVVVSRKKMYGGLYSAERGNSSLPDGVTARASYTVSV